MNAQRYPGRALKQLKFPLVISFAFVFLFTGIYFSFASIADFNCLHLTQVQSEVCRADTIIGPSHMEVDWSCPPFPMKCPSVFVNTCDPSGSNCVNVTNSLGGGDGIWLCQNCYMQVQEPNNTSATVYVTSPGNGVPLFIGSGILFPVGVYIRLHKEPKTILDVANEFT